MNKIAFVIPWFGEKIPGGAESACRDISKNMEQRGYDVEIITTCIKEFGSDWSKNFYKEGIEVINNIPVRRFPVKTCNRKAFDEINYKLINKMPVNGDEEKIFFEEMIKCEPLYRYLAENSDNYACFLFMPYMFTTSIQGVASVRDKSMLIPCLHDESYAYLKPVKTMFESSKGIIYLSKPEKDLAEKLYNIDKIPAEVIGTGIHTKLDYNVDRFIKKYDIKRPFLLYAGRKDQGKNVHQLLDFYKQFIEEHNVLDLVLIGGGDIEIPKEIIPYTHDLGFVSLEDKYSAFAAAEILCQPSKNESFSIVIMESWLCETPVIVNAYCDVTRNFCEESNGGLYYADYEEFKGCLLYMLDHPNHLRKMALNGKSYVKSHYEWDVVVEKYIEFIKKF